MIPKTVSATSLNTYKNCPLQWKYHYIYKLLQPDNPAFIIGIAYHKALEIFYRSPEKPLLEILDEIKKDLMPNKTKEEIDRYAIVRKMVECYIENPVSEMTQQIEYKFSHSLKDLLDENINLFGYIDRVTENSIIDYKTSSEDYTEQKCLDNIQTDIYSYVMWKERGKLPNVIYHIMNKKKVGKNNYIPQVITIKKTVEDMKNLEDKIKEFYDNVINERFEPSQGNHCWWCSYKSHCPYR